MGPVPFAFSIHHFINSVGADAGFASIIGLAILVLLYFSQARESASLRDQANESAQRVAQLEARIAGLARAQAAPAPAPLAAQAGASPSVAALANRVPAATAGAATASPGRPHAPPALPFAPGAPA